MKFKIIMIAIIMTMIIAFNVSAVSAAEMTPEELYFNQTHLISVTNVNGDTFTFEYEETDNELYKINIMKNGVKLSTPSYSVTTDIAYFYLGKYVLHNGIGCYEVNLRYYDFEHIWRENPGYTYVRASGFDYVIMPGPPTGQYDHLKGTIRITEPPYDNWNTTDSRIKIKYSFGLPKPVSDFDIIISGGGEVIGSNKLVNTNEDDNWKFFYYEVYRDLPEVNNTITVNVPSYDLSASRIIHRYFGVIDEDGDGIDDRTGLPVGGPGSNLTPEGAPVLPDNATIFDYVKYAVDSIIYVFAQTGLAIKGLIGGIGDIGKILTGFFSFMPQPFTGIIVIGLLIAIILRIFGR